MGGNGDTSCNYFVGSMQKLQRCKEEGNVSVVGFSTMFGGKNTFSIRSVKLNLFEVVLHLCSKIQLSEKKVTTF